MIWYHIIYLYDLPHSKLPADHLSINIIPFIITDSAPSPVMVHLHTPLEILKASHEPQGGTIA